MRCLFRLSILFLFLSFATNGFAWQLKGQVTDSTGAPIPYVSIFISNTTYGVATNPKGNYYLELDDGSYTVVFQAVGFEKQEHKVNIKSANARLNVTLLEKSFDLDAVEVTAGRRDPAYDIIKNAIKARKNFIHPTDQYSCTNYTKASLESEPIKLDKIPDSLLVKGVRERMNLVESYSTLYYRAPNDYKEVVSAYNDLSEKSQSSVSVSISSDDDYLSSGPPQYVEINPFLFYLSPTDADFNFYESSMSLPRLGQTPFLSPIGLGALLAYKYRLEETFYQDGVLTYKIEVIPRFPEDPLFSGYIYIRDRDWNIKAVDLEVGKGSLNFFKYFRIIAEYEAHNDSVWLPTHEEFYYNTRSSGKLLIGNTVAVYSDYNLDPEIAPRFFKNEIKLVEDEAYDKDTTFWNSVRQVTLKDEEREFIDEQDSIARHHQSPEYLAERDSAYNHHNFWDYTLNGVGWRNRAAGRHIYFDPLIEQLEPFGVGGYRHALGGGFDKTWDKENTLYIGYEADYGFNNQDLKGDLSVGYLYNPKKFAKVEVSFGDEYRLVNNYESIENFFSRSNYVQNQFWGASHRMEFWNGVYVKGGVEYSDMKSIQDIKLADWSNDLFGDNNIPIAFDRYRQFVFNVKVDITFRQKYYTLPNKKVIVGTKYPKLGITYKKGIPGILKSDVNFDFLEINAFHDFKIGSWGESKFNVITGRFLNSGGIRLMNEKFFRQSDTYFFSNPLLSFQLLSPPDGVPNISTPYGYFQGNYIHSFRGAILNKIPLINKLGLEASGGAGMLLIEENNFRHLEAFVGIGKQVRIFKQLWKFSVYGVAADSNQASPDATLKFGIDFYNAFTNKWSY